MFVLALPKMPHGHRTFAASLHAGHGHAFRCATELCPNTVLTNLIGSHRAQRSLMRDRIPRITHVFVRMRLCLVDVLTIVIIQCKRFL